MRRATAALGAAVLLARCGGSPPGNQLRSPEDYGDSGGAVGDVMPGEPIRPVGRRYGISHGPAHSRCGEHATDSDHLSFSVAITGGRGHMDGLDVHVAGGRTVFSQYDTVLCRVPDSRCH